jgi:hypothetical protein
MNNKQCPWCQQETDLELSNDTDMDVQVRCANCGCYGPWAGSATIAWELWNDRQEADK